MSRRRTGHPVLGDSDGRLWFAVKSDGSTAWFGPAVPEFFGAKSAPGDVYYSGKVFTDDRFLDWREWRP